MARLVDSVDGVETWFEKDPWSGRITLHNRQNVDAHLRFNAQGRSTPHIHRELGHHVARVPMVVVAQWVDEAGLTMREFNTWTNQERRRFLALRLNDSDNKNLKNKIAPIVEQRSKPDLRFAKVVDMRIRRRKKKKRKATKTTRPHLVMKRTKCVSR